MRPFGRTIMMTITARPYITRRQSPTARSSSGSAQSSTVPSTEPVMEPMPPKMTMMVYSVDLVIRNILGWR